MNIDRMRDMQTYNLINNLNSQDLSDTEQVLVERLTEYMDFLEKITGETEIETVSQKIEMLSDFLQSSTTSIFLKKIKELLPTFELLNNFLYDDDVGRFLLYIESIINKD